MNINFSGFNEKVVTFECENTVAAGKLVKMSANGKVANAAANDDFIGVALSVNGGYAAVQIGGYVELVKTGTVNVGYNKLVAATNAVKTAESGIDRLVVLVDGNLIGFIL